MLDEDGQVDSESDLRAWRNWTLAFALLFGSFCAADKWLGSHIAFFLLIVVIAAIALCRKVAGKPSWPIVSLGRHFRRD